MILKVSSQNEFRFYPDISNNMELPENERFTVVLKRLNNVLNAKVWTSYTKEGGIEIDILKKYKKHIVKIENAPLLQMESGEQRELTIDDLFNEEFTELEIILNQIVDEINRLSETGSLEVKK